MRTTCPGPPCQQTASRKAKKTLQARSRYQLCQQQRLSGPCNRHNRYNRLNGTGHFPRCSNHDAVSHDLDDRSVQLGLRCMFRIIDGNPHPGGCVSPAPHTDIPASGSHLQTYPRHKKSRWQMPAASLPHFVRHCLSIPPVNRRLHSTFSRGLRQRQRIARDQLCRRNIVYRSGWVL